MCILLWTLPTSNHPRFKFAFASNRDESITRETSRADFWDVESILNRATNLTKVPTNAAQATLGSLPDNGIVESSSNGDRIGILSGQDKQPAQTENYVFKETETTATGEEKVTLMLSTEDVPGTWLGITTHGDLVGLTNYRETAEYLSQKRPPKLSRGKVCGEFLVTMAAARDGGAVVANDRAEQWIKRRAVGWDTEFEGLNLLVVQNAGEQQCVGGNREGSELTVYDTPENAVTSDHPRQTIEPGSVVGVSNSVFKRPWSKVQIGTQALEKTLNESIGLFGAGPRASLQDRSNTCPHLASDDDTVELAWLVIEMLTLLRVNTKPFPKDISDSASVVLGLRERVFVPLIHEYGTRSSTVILFGRNNRLAVYVEKVWHGPPDETTGDRIEFAPDSADGLLWLQGLVGQPRKEWKRIEGQELEDLVRSAKEAQKFNAETQS